jgi:hypothetical protein
MCVGLYDGKRKQILLGFGNNEVAVFADLLALKL